MKGLKEPFFMKFVHLICNNELLAVKTLNQGYFQGLREKVNTSPTLLTRIVITTTKTHDKPRENILIILSKLHIL